MSGRVLLDVNMHREVCDRLRDLGFDSIYLTEVFPPDTEDEKIFEWMEQNHIPIITKDKRFPENGGNLKIVLEGESTVRLTRRALHKLMENMVYPDPLVGSWKNCSNKK